MSIEKFEAIRAGQPIRKENMLEMLQAWRAAHDGCVRVFISATAEAIDETAPLITPLCASFSAPIMKLEDGRHDYFVEVTPEGGDKDNIQALAKILRRPGITINNANRYTTEGAAELIL